MHMRFLPSNALKLLRTMSIIIICMYVIHSYNLLSNNHDLEYKYEKTYSCKYVFLHGRSPDKPIKI